MGYLINIDIDGYEFQFGELNHHTTGKGVWIDFENEKIKKSIENSEPELLSAIVKLFEQHEELDALSTMNSFEHYYLQGHGWYSLTQNYSFSGLERFKKQAEIVLKSERADEEQIRVAKTILDVLSGSYRAPPRPEKSPEEKARAAFERKRDKLRLKITIERGYKCDQCAKSDEGSLCIIRKDDSVVNYELDNLVLRCRSCTGKMKKRK